jgi:sulfur dioxygenase
MNKLIFRQLFDYDTWTYTYLLADPVSKEAVLIDTVRERADRDLALLRELDLKLKYVLDTHVHADHITGAAKLKAATDAKSGLSKNAAVKAAELALEDGQELRFGAYSIKVISTPGHTDTCLSYYCAGMVFTGDTLLIRDVGRTDFQQGSNEKMFHSITHKLFSLPPETLVYPGHDYNGHEVSTIGEEMAFNGKAGGRATFSQFKERMEAMKLAPPKRLHVSVPANLLGGKDPEVI